MSVLVEAITVAVTREALAQRSYPGGVAAFIALMDSGDFPVRHVCADDQIVCVSFRTLADATVVTDLLDVYCGYDAKRATSDWVVLEQQVGPTWPREDWIECAANEDEIMRCWVAGSDPGPMVVPPGWTPENSRRLECHLKNELHGAIAYCYSVESIAWVDVQAGESVPGYSLPPVETPEELARQAQLFFDE